MTHRIEIGLKRGIKDARGRAVAARARRFLRIPVGDCRTRDVYKLDMALSREELESVKNAFTDPVTSRSSVGRLASPVFDWMVEVGDRKSTRLNSSH